MDKYHKTFSKGFNTNNLGFELKASIKNFKILTVVNKTDKMKRKYQIMTQYFLLF